MRKKLLLIGVISLLSISQSCSNSEELSSKNTSQVEKTNGMSNRMMSNSKSLSGYVSDILSIQTEIKSILDNESNANFSMIQSGIENVKTVEDLKLLYRNANVIHVEELISLYTEMSQSSETFIKSNSEFYTNFNEEKRKQIIYNEIDTQLGYNEFSETARTNCHANFTKASGRCMRNYAIAMTGVAVSGFFSFGVGTVVGGAVATTMMIMCNSDADADYHDCVHDGGQP